VRCAHRACGRRRPALLVRLAGLGLCFEGAWYCCVRCLDEAVRRRAGTSWQGRDQASRPTGAAPGRGLVAQAASFAAPLRLGAILANQVGLSPAVLAEALAGQACTGLRLGAQLVSMGAVTDHEITRALAAQAGVPSLPSLDASHLEHEAALLSRDTARALGLVPFGTDAANGAIRVACCAPLPRLALAIMADLTDRRIEAYIVSDEQFAAVMDAYPGRDAAAGHGVAPAVPAARREPAPAFDAGPKTPAHVGPRGPLYEVGRTEWRAASTSR
jgi:hypothetical protein